VTDIRFGSAADVPAIARVRHESWRAAYTGIIPAATIERVTGRYDDGQEQAWFAARPWRLTLVAEQTPPAEAAEQTSPAGVGEQTSPAEIVGYASYGPERGLNGVPRTTRDAPEPPRRAELYALYVAPGWWSTGTGRALMQRVLEETRREGYPQITVWVLEQNARARRFYERAGFRLQGRSHVLYELGGVTEISYEQDIAPP
jgi:GNAT superfamily N-acetyltransferase